MTLTVTYPDPPVPPTAAAIAEQVRAELAVELARVDVPVSSRATPGQLTAARDAVLAAVGTPAQAAALAALAATVGTPAQAAAVAALGTPAQASAVAALAVATGTPAQAAVLASAVADLLLSLAGLEAIVQTRATPADLAVTVTGTPNVKAGP